MTMESKASVEKISDGRIIVAVDDMFFAAKILGAAQNLGRTVERVKTVEQLFASLPTEAPALLLIDLNSAQFDALQLIASLKSQAKYAALTVLGFLSHVQVDLKRQAEAIGCDSVMTRSAFSQALAEILTGQLPKSSAKQP